MTDISVKPKRTFWHDELKTKHSPAFPVETGIGHELKVLGLVDIIGDVADEEPAAVDLPLLVDDVEPVVVEPAPKKKGKANAIDKDS